MSFFSQIGILLLISGISIVLLRTNRDLEKACREGEHFVDEWAMMLEKKTGYEDSSGAGIQESIPEESVHREEAAEGRSGELSPEETSDLRVKEDKADYDPAFLPYLQMLDEEGHPLGKVRVARLPFVIGRDPSCDLRLSDLCVARRHCRITAREGKLFLEDLGTRNRMMADGRETDRVLLREGLRLQIGETGMAVFFPERSAIGKEMY